MKKVLLSLFLFIAMFVCFTPAWSQIMNKEKKMAKMTSTERATKTTDWMKSNLKLSPDQASKVTDINMKYAEKNQAIYDGTKTKGEKMDMMKANDASKEAELKSLFTADQYKMYNSKKGELKKAVKD